jgi:endonuclease/exonuclease/phosphatase (EEP) superfamily protein YafD
MANDGVSTADAALAPAWSRTAVAILRTDWRGRKLGERMIGWLGKALTVASAALLLAVALGYGGGLSWFFDLFANFQFQYLMAGAVLLPLALLLRRWLGAALLVAAIGGSVLMLAQVPVQQEEGGVAAPVPGLRIASFNVLFDNRTHDAALRFADAEQPDVIVFQEFARSWLPNLEALRARYPHQAAFTFEGGVTDVVVVSRLPLIEPRLVDTERRLRIVTAGVEIEGRRLQIIGLHPPVPLLPEVTAERARHFELVARLVNASPHPSIVIGDFNATLWGAPLRFLFAQTSLRAHSRWPQPTYAADLPWPMRIAIDHMLVSPGLRIVQMRKSEPLGSDHFPVVARVEVGR